MPGMFACCGISLPLVRHARKRIRGGFVIVACRVHHQDVVQVEPNHTLDHLLAVTSNGVENITREDVDLTFDLLYTTAALGAEGPVKLGYHLRFLGCPRMTGARPGPVPTPTVTPLGSHCEPLIGLPRTFFCLAATAYMRGQLACLGSREVLELRLDHRGPVHASLAAFGLLRLGILHAHEMLLGFADRWHLYLEVSSGFGRSRRAASEHRPLSRLARRENLC